ncbi:MAG: UDP-N-acetylmuramoyl-L-alanine--D-glutamate ligase, partial [Planctomycetes bacterium]|nr:UDP-N-acetylmuramoyl-L-alanine--D-glutamate ligase [Planctomycetota bacterium]
MGLGLFGGGVGVSRFLVRAGARVVVTDLKREEDLRESVAELRGLPVELHLGGHRDEDFAGADLVIVNPAVPESSPYLRAAKALDTEMNLFFKLCRAERIVGITGSNGKTTTTALVGEILRRGPARVHVGGNIGVSLIERIEEIAPEDVVVLELSSFQLENLGALRRSPNVSAVMNLTPNHLDRHGTMENYVAAKRQIVAHQRADDWKVLNRDDPLVRDFAKAAPSRNAFFSIREPVERGAQGDGETILLRMTGSKFAIDVSRRKLPGWFNLQNMSAAAAASFVAAGAHWEGWRDAAEEVFRTFPGVEHRLEFVAEKGGVKFYNDSIATNPESTIAALDVLPGPVVLLAGGYDKKLPFEGLAERAAGRARVVVTHGQTGPAIAALLRGRGPEVIETKGFEQAVRAAAAAARPGDTVLLSPACASYDLFRNFAERGRKFKELVAALPGPASEPH